MAARPPPTPTTLLKQPNVGQAFAPATPDADGFVDVSEGEPLSQTSSQACEEVAMGVALEPVLAMPPMVMELHCVWVQLLLEHRQYHYDRKLLSVRLVTNLAKLESTITTVYNLFTKHLPPTSSLREDCISPMELASLPPPGVLVLRSSDKVVKAQQQLLLESAYLVCQYRVWQAWKEQMESLAPLVVELKEAGAARALYILAHPELVAAADEYDKSVLQFEAETTKNDTYTFTLVPEDVLARNHLQKLYVLYNWDFDRLAADMQNMHAANLQKAESE